MSYRETLINSTGTRICLSIWENGGNCPVVIFTPGTMVHPLFYEEFLGHLSLKGFTILGVHPVSHGKSPRERKLYSFEDLKQNVKDAITYARNNYSSAISLMGSSQGGILAAAVAAEDDRIAAVFPHNIMIPQLPETIGLTRFPRFLRHVQKPAMWLIKTGGKILPGLQLPYNFYLEPDRVTSSPELQSKIDHDPLFLRTYPLYFLASLFNADMSGICDGSIKCPVIAIVSSDEPLFSFDYTKLAFDKIKAPVKEMLVFDLPCHLILNECVDAVLEPIAGKIKQYMDGQIAAAADIETGN
ncbi:MAG: alpha/beta fold hydrolase [Dehalococcoidia bacterium]|nr:alpha/beta fold hydrolase [Dehalococcoidia bacterium]